MGYLTDAISKAIKNSDESPCEIAKNTGVARSQLSRMMRGLSGMNADTIERLAEYLDLRITIESKNTSRTGKYTHGKHRT